MESPLPDFAKPPVTEVVLGMQFDALPRLRSLQIARLWQEAYRDRFPVTEEHVPLDPIVEKFGVVKQPRATRIVAVLDSPPVPRYWFMNATNGTDLVQVQQDRFVRNW